MLKRYKVFVGLNIIGTVGIDADSADEAKDMVEGMDSNDVLSDMLKDNIEVCADDAEEIEEDG